MFPSKCDGESNAKTDDLHPSVAAGRRAAQFESMLVSSSTLARQAAGLTSWCGPAVLAVTHAVLLWGLLDHHAAARGVAAYLEMWPVAEAISLVMAPYLMLITVRDHETPLWERIIWLPLIMLALGGIFGTIRFLRATWVYFVARIPTVLYERSTRQQASIGCARSVLAIAVLMILLAIFANRPTQFPIGTIAGRGLDPAERSLANSMAMGAAYFAALTVADILIHRATRTAGRRTAE